MRKVNGFTTGVVKSRERALLGDSLARLADGSAEEAFKAIKDSGFGSGSGVDSPFGIDKLLRFEEENLNAFIREYAPDDRTERFLLAGYDFHNAEALLKVARIGADEEKLLLPEGSFPVADLKATVSGNSPASVPAELAAAVRDGDAMFEEGNANGFLLDSLFKKALFAYLKRIAKGRVLKSILSARQDYANISIALRSRDAKEAEELFVDEGKCPKSQLIDIIGVPPERIAAGEYAKEIKAAAAEIAKAGSLTAFEKQADDYPLALLYPTRYDFAGAEPFLSYIYKKRADIANVRILIVCLNAGLPAGEIKRRLRSI